MDPIVKQVPFESKVQPQAIALPILAGLSCLLSLPLLVLQHRAQNTPLFMLVLSSTVSNTGSIINPIIWSNDDLDGWWDGKILCDIEVKLMLGIDMVIGGSVLCILRQLAAALNTDRPRMILSPVEKRSKFIFETVFCFVIPIYLMAIHVVFQEGRYYIFIVSGCQPSLDTSWLCIILVVLLPLVTRLIGLFYEALTIYRLVRYRRQVASILADSQNWTTKSRFYRLFAIATYVSAVCTPGSVRKFVSSLSDVENFYSWSTTHTPGWTTLIFKWSARGHIFYDRWLQVSIGFVLFLAFGFGEDAMELYRVWLQRCGMIQFVRRCKCFRPRNGHQDQAANTIHRFNILPLNSSSSNSRDRTGVESDGRLRE